MGRVTGIRLPSKYRRQRGGGAMTSDNLRVAPSWITPAMVRQVLELVASAPPLPAPVERVATPRVKPTLKIVANEQPRLDPDSATSATKILCASARYPDWTADEDSQLRDAYASGARIDELARRLKRPLKGAYSRAHKLGLMTERTVKGGFVTSPKWTSDQDQCLRDGYGQTSTREIAEKVGRGVRAVYQRAFALGLDSGTGIGRPWSGRERLAMRIAFNRGIAIADVATALGKKQGTVCRHATKNGMDFGRRSLLIAPLSIDDLLLLEDPRIATPTTKRDVYRAREKNSEEGSGTARKAPGAISSGVAKRGSASSSPFSSSPERAMGSESRAAPTKRKSRSRLEPFSEVPPPPDCQAGQRAPSREPAPMLPAARAHSPQARPPSFLQYADRIGSARRHLEARHFTVRRFDRDEVIPRWQVSGQYGLLSNEDLIALACRHGLELVDA